MWYYFLFWQDELSTVFAPHPSDAGHDAGRGKADGGDRDKESDAEEEEVVAGPVRPGRRTAGQVDLKQLF